MIIHSHTLGTNRLIFDDAFLRQVAEYHAGVQRPDGTFSNAAEANGSELGRNSNVDSLDMENLSIDRLDVGVTAATVANTVVETGRGQRRNPRGKDSQQLRELEDAANMKRLPLSQNEASSGSLIDDLAAVRREKCHVCGCKRQIYCGDCGGVRMVAGGASLPPRFLLPFDVLLVMHW